MLDALHGIRRMTARPPALFLALAALAVAAGGLAEAQDRAASETPGGASGPSGAVATIGADRITESQLEAFVAPQLMSLRRQRQDVLEQGLDRLLAQRLLSKEAEAKGVSMSELLQQEVTAKVAAPTDEEVDEFYESQKDRIGAPKAQVAERIRQYLTQQKQQASFTAYTDGLKEKYGARVLLPPLRIDVDSADAPAKGPADAPVTLVEFGDFECPYCAGLEKTLSEILAHYGDDVRLVFRQFPLENIHPAAFTSAEASLCAREQDKFWELHDAMYSDQEALSAADLKGTAMRLGMDSERFDRCLDTGKYEAAIRADMRAGEEAGITGTPALFVNGRLVPGGAAAYEVIADLIDEELARPLP